MKKLVQINVTCNGSTGRIMEQIQKKAIEEGFEAYSFYGRGKPSNDRCIKIGNKIDIYWNVFLTRVFDKHGYGSKRATKKLIEKIKKINPDIIQLHNIHGYYINLKILFNYLKKSNIKIVWTFHDCWNFTGHCSYFDSEGCNKWKEICHKCPQRKKYPKSVLLDNSRKQFKFKKKLFTNINNLVVVTPSKWLANLVKQSFLKEYQVKVINNGIDLKKFKPIKSIDIRKKYAIPKDKKIVLGVAANWDERKGLKDFIKLSEIIEKDTIIVLVGLNREQIKSLPQNIIGISRTENTEELANIYSISKVFVNLTHEDNFPTTNLEAQACGIPVITYNTGGSAESVNEKVGRIVDKYNIKKVKKEIDLIENNAFSQKDILDNSKKYDGNKKYKEYINMYNKIIERKQSK